jgi:hypothetical protein
VVRAWRGKRGLEALTRTGEEGEDYRKGVGVRRVGAFAVVVDRVQTGGVRQTENRGREEGREGWCDVLHVCDKKSQADTVGDSTALQRHMLEEEIGVWGGGECLMGVGKE